MAVNFDWDSGNLTHIMDDYPSRKNTVSEVESLFDNPNGKVSDDIAHSHQEDRFTLVAESNLNRILVVAYTIRDGRIRPISCRPANRQERKRYDK